MALGPLGLKQRLMRRRERLKDKRMALRLAVLLGALIALPFAYWQLQLHEVLRPTADTATLEKQCENLDETFDAVAREAGKPIGLNKEALDYRRSECEEMGFEIKTGSIPE